MPKKRILIWSSFPLKERSGGPSTYLYNLKSVLNSENHIIEFLADLIPKNKINNIPNNNPIYNYIKHNLPKKLYEKYIRVKKSYRLVLQSYSPSNFGFDYLELDNYAAIHFHNTIDLIKAMDRLVNFKGKIILTSHSPCAPFKDELNTLGLSKKNLSEKKYKKIINSDIKAFLRADIIVVPCIEAIEAYQKDYEPSYNFNKILEKKALKFITTGTIVSNYKQNRKEIRHQLEIPEDALVLHFSGRHNKDKGYDILVEFGHRILNNNKNVFFVITGKINNQIPFPKNKRWIEIGWTNDPFSYANASDMFILPNRVTYFDLVLLEMFSIGIPALISDAGGNKFFKKFEDKMDIKMFEKENIDDMIKQFKHLSNCHKLKNNNLIFEKYFTIEKMKENYEVFYNNLISNE